MSILVIDDWCISCEIAIRWMYLDLTDDKSTLVQVMAWCHQATSLYLSQCWPRSMSPYGVIRPQWVNSSRPMQWRIYTLTTRLSLVQIMTCCLFGQLIICTDDGLLLTGPLRTNFGEIQIIYSYIIQLYTPRHLCREVTYVTPEPRQVTHIHNCE